MKRIDVNNMTSADRRAAGLWAVPVLLLIMTLTAMTLMAGTPPGRGLEPSGWSMALAVGDANGPGNSDTPPLKLNEPNEEAFRRPGEEAFRATPSNETVSGPAFTLEAATISMGGGVLDDGSIAVIGQALVGTMSGSGFTIEVGIVPMLVDGVPCTEDCDCDDGDACTNDECNGGVCPNPNPQRLYGDIDGDGDIDLFDLFCVLNGFSGDFSTCCFSNIDIEPCSGDDDIDLFDLFGVLNAFSGINACSCPLGP